VIAAPLRSWSQSSLADLSACRGTDTHLNYMINIAFTTEFAIAAVGAR
jgi:hypothetical protein